VKAKKRGKRKNKKGRNKKKKHFPLSYKQQFFLYSLAPSLLA
jgi:hypothetical protein